MIYQASNKKDIKNIKTNQIYGVELEPKMYALAFTNMILLGDGRSNLFNDDSFNEEIIKNLKEKANKCFLNSPYSKNKKRA